MIERNALLSKHVIFNAHMPVSPCNVRINQNLQHHFGRALVFRQFNTPQSSIAQMHR